MLGLELIHVNKGALGIFTMRRTVFGTETPVAITLIWYDGYNQHKTCDLGSLHQIGWL